MRRLGLIAGMALVLAATAVVAMGVRPAEAQDSAGDAKTVLPIGWVQDPKTLNPFVGLDEESFSIWAIQWDLLVNFDPVDLSPAPGIAESWKVSDDKKTVTFKLDPDRKWSDGKPITSKDVKWSLEVLGSEGTYFTGYTSSITSIQTPDDYTVVIKTKQPDVRIVGGLFVYILPEHIWGRVPIDEVTGAYEPDVPMVGSGPYVATEFERAQIIRMERNPEWTGEEGGFDELQYIKYGNADGAERALELGEVDLIPEVEAASFDRLGEEEDIATQQAPTPAYTQLAFNLCPPQKCPDAIRNPAVTDRDVRQATAYAIDRERLNEIATQGTSFVANGILPAFYKSFYEEPEQTYPYDPEMANQILDDAGWVMNGDGVREKDGEELSFNLYVRSESQFTIQMARLIAEQTAEVGIEFNVQIVSTDKLTELTIRKIDGKPAPEFDTFIWGWGGDPYDPSFLLSILTSGEIGGSSDAFFSNPEYDRLFREQAVSFDVEERAELIHQMVAITQEELPYLVLTEDPQLQAYRTDRIQEIQPVCPEETGDLLCDQVTSAGVTALQPVEGASVGGGATGGSTGLYGLVGLIIGFLGGVLVTRNRRGQGREPLELPE
jgi:peptide/nickel transport system substrate-binding protein